MLLKVILIELNLAINDAGLSSSFYDEWVQYSDIYGERSIGISFYCTWDIENEAGVYVNYEKVIDVGYQYIAI